MERSDIILGELPMPIATEYRNAINAIEVYESAKRLLALAEHSVQYLALVACAATWHSSSGFDDPTRRALHEALPRPSFGRWLGLLRTLEQSAPLREPLALELSERRDDLESYVELAQRLNLKSNGRRPRINDVLEGLVQLRNSVEHHGQSIDVLQRHRDLLRTTVEQVLCAIPILRSGHLVVAERVVTLRGGQVEAVFRVHRGGLSRVETKRHPVASNLSSNTAYLRPVGSETFIELAPFILPVGEHVTLLAGLDAKRRAKYICPYAEVPSTDYEEADGELRTRMPFLYDGAIAVQFDALLPLAEIVLADGVVTTEEISVLGRRAMALGIASTMEQGQKLAEAAIQHLRGEAEVIGSSPEVVVDAVAAPTTVEAVAIDPTPPTSEDEVPLGFDPVQALVDLGRRLEPQLRRLGGLQGELVDDGKTVTASFRFKHAVWREMHSIDLELARSAAPGEHATIRPTVAFWYDDLPSPLARALRAEIATSDALVGLRVERDSNNPTVTLSCGDGRLRFLSDAEAALQPWFDIVRPVIEQLWDGLPRWAQLVSTNKADGHSIAALKKAMTPEAEKDFAFAWTMAMQHCGNASFGKAADWTRETLALAPTSASAHGLMGWLLADAGRHSEAMDHYDVVLADGDGVDIPVSDLEDIAKVAEKARAFDKALALWDRLLLIDETRPGVLVSRGSLLRLNLRRPEDAEAAFRRALELGIDVVRAAENLGAILRDRGDLEGAAAAIRLGTRQDGTLPPQLAKALERVERRKASS